MNNKLIEFFLKDLLMEWKQEVLVWVFITFLVVDLDHEEKLENLDKGDNQ